MTNPTLDAVLEGIADAISAAEFGYDMCLTKLVDGVSTYTLTIKGQSSVDFSNTEDCYEYIHKEKRIRKARAALSSEPLASILRRAVEALRPFSSIVDYQGATGKDINTVRATLAALKALTGEAG